MTQSAWPVAATSNLIEACRQNKSPQEIAAMLGPNYKPHQVGHKIGQLRDAGIYLGPRYAVSYRQKHSNPEKASEGLKAKFGDLKFKKAMLRARKHRDEKFVLEVKTANGTDNPSHFSRPGTYMPGASNISER